MNFLDIVRYYAKMASMVTPWADLEKRGRVKSVNAMATWIKMPLATVMARLESVFDA